MTPSQATALKAAIKNLVAAEVADSWKGGGDPADIPFIKADLRAARTRVETYVNKLTEHKPK